VDAKKPEFISENRLLGALPVQVRRRYIFLVRVILTPAFGSSCAELNREMTMHFERA